MAEGASGEEERKGSRMGRWSRNQLDTLCHPTVDMILLPNLGPDTATSYQPTLAIRSIEIYSKPR